MDEKEFASLLDMVDERAAKREAKREAEAKAKAEAEAKEVETRKTLESELRGKIEAELKAEGVVWKEGKINVVKSENLGDGQKSYDRGFMHWAQTGDPTYITRDASIGDGEIKKAMAGASGDGAYIVPEDWNSRIIELRDPMSWPRAAGVSIFSAQTDRVNLPAEDTAIGMMTRAAEAGAFATDDPSFAANAVSVEAWTTACRVSRQLLSDSPMGFEQYYQRFVARMLAQTESYYCAIGSGTNEHTGVFEGGDTDAITINSDNGYTSDEVLTGDALWAIYYTLGEGYRQDAVWLMNGTTAKLFATAKVGGQENYAFPSVQLASFSGGRLNLLGRPVFEQASIDSFAANKGFAAFGVPQYYTLVEREGLSVIRDPYTRASSGEVVFHNFARQTGLVTVASAWVIASGS